MIEDIRFGKGLSHKLVARTEAIATGLCTKMVTPKIEETEGSLKIF